MNNYWQKIKKFTLSTFKKKDEKVVEDKITQVLNNYIIKNSSSKTLLLDAGCDQGAFAKDLFNQGFKGNYFGVDNNVKMIKLAKKNLKSIINAKFFKESLNKMHFSNSYFDIVLIKDVIEFEQYYSKILTEISRVAKKYFILSMSIKPLSFLPDLIKKNKDGRYQNRYNQKKLFGFLKKHRFIKPNKIYEDWQNITYVFEK